MEHHTVHRGAFECTRLKILLTGDNNTAGDEPETGHSHEHSHASAHDHSHEHSHTHTATTHALPGEPERSLSSILQLIDSSELPRKTRENAKDVFRRLGEAEARVHGVDIEEIHFHEVGAVDSIVDIVGSCLALELLGIDEVYCAPVTVGTGFVSGAHGRMPLPAPATAELLKGFPIQQMDSGAELTTPTGAALMTTLAKGFGPMPSGTISAIGLGAGDERAGPTPNALRVFLADKIEQETGRDRVLLLETNIDDMSSEWIGHLMDRLFEVGALDVYVTPILMKKTRPAHKLSILGPLPLEKEIADVLFTESTTIGVRRTEIERIVLERETTELDSPWGPVRVKIARHGGEEVGASPEYEDLKRLAGKAGLPIKEVHRRVMELFHKARG